MELPFKFSKSDISALILILLLALFIRAPFVSTGLPFFYSEDEAHHFNRVVNMVKTGSWNPNYFHKPSLHFYLRMPVVAASFLWGVKQGHIRRVEEIQTKDPFGLGEYAFTASHEGIVKWNRAFSLILSLGLIVMTYALARRLFNGSGILLPAAATVPAIFSPDLVNYSAYIGVDILMALLCIASIYASLYVLRFFSLKGLFFCGVLCGLAISSKYNALPIAFIPIIVSLSLGRMDCWTLSTAFLSPLLGFLIGSPFILLSLPLFLNQFAYEIWHYGIAGHEGHMAEPGMAQLFHYLEWLASSALGYAFLGFALLGVVVLLVKKDIQTRLFLFFPLVFTGLMCVQKVNFERNMLVVIPFFGITAIAGLNSMLKKLNLNKSVMSRVFVILILLFTVQPGLHAFDKYRQAQAVPDSRRELEAYLTELSGNKLRIALAGQLQMPTRIYKLPGITRVDQDKITAEGGQGLSYDKYVFHGPTTVLGNDFVIEKEIPGEARPQRVVRNPLIQIFSRKKGE